MKVTILGAGTWGTALAQVLTDGEHEVFMWDVNSDLIKSLHESRNHPNLKGFKLSPRVIVSEHLDSFPLNDLIVIVVPSQVVREVLGKLPKLSDSTTIVCASKGIENSTLLRMSEVINEVTGLDNKQIVALSGPSHAEEVSKKLPTAIVSACTDLNTARKIQKVFTTSYFRVYSNNDIIGVELSGAVKNVIAIAAGICMGIGFGDNTMAALVTRGLAEIIRLGISLGAKRETFAGLSGIGDLVVTANSTHSRNRYVGRRMGEGATLQMVLDEMKMIAEGVKTTRSVHDVSLKTGIEMPICEQVHNILFKQKDPKVTITELMGRELVDEQKA